MCGASSDCVVLVVTVVLVVMVCGASSDCVVLVVKVCGASSDGVRC